MHTLFVSTTQTAFDELNRTFFIFLMMVDDLNDVSSENVSFNMGVHIRTAMCLHYLQLFITAVRMHLHHSGEYLVHLLTKWAANLHYSISVYPGISFTHTGRDKTLFVAVTRLNSHTYVLLWDFSAHTKRIALPFSLLVSSSTTDMTNPL